MQAHASQPALLIFQPRDDPRKSALRKKVSLGIIPIAKCAAGDLFPTPIAAAYH